MENERHDLLVMYKKEHPLLKRALYRPNLREDPWHKVGEVLNEC